VLRQTRRRNRGSRDVAARRWAGAVLRRGHAARLSPQRGSVRFAAPQAERRVSQRLPACVDDDPARFEVAGKRPSARIRAALQPRAARQSPELNGVPSQPSPIEVERVYFGRRMADHLSPFESNTDAVLRRLDEIDHRLRALEARLEGLRAPVLDAPLAEPTGSSDRFGSRPGLSSGTIASFAGRTCLVLGGGYLLRALADFGVLPLPFAVALGQLYALSWFFVADRAGKSGKATSATFAGLAATA